MKKYICILAGAASLLAACEQKTETANPPAESKTENSTTVVNPSASPATTNKTETNTTINAGSSPTSTTTASPTP